MKRMMSTVSGANMKKSTSCKKTTSCMDLVRKFHLDGIEIEQHTKVGLPLTAKDVGEKLEVWK